MIFPYFKDKYCVVYTDSSENTLIDDRDVIYIRSMKDEVSKLGQMIVGKEISRRNHRATSALARNFNATLDE